MLKILSIDSSSFISLKPPFLIFHFLRVLVCFTHFSANISLRHCYPTENTTGFYVGRFVGGDRSSIKALFFISPVFPLLVHSAGSSPLFSNCFDAFEAKKGLFWR